jgi:hypothetical protein
MSAPEMEDLARDAMRFQAKVDAIGKQIEMLAKIFGPPDSEQKPDIFSVNHKPTKEVNNDGDKED